MPSLGPAEILVILVVALLVFGPDKMPDMARKAGNAYRELRRMQQHLRSEISGAMADLETGSAGSADSPGAVGTMHSDPTDADVMNAARPGGDPAPMLPPKEPASAETDAAPADPLEGPPQAGGAA